MSCDFSRRVLDLADGLGDDEAQAHLDDCLACQELYAQTVGVERATPQPRRVLDQPWRDLGVRPAQAEERSFVALGLFGPASEPAQREYTLRFTQDEVRLLNLWGIGSDRIASRAEVRGFELRLDRTSDPGHQGTDDSECACLLTILGAREPLFTIDMGTHYGYGDPAAEVRRSCRQLATEWGVRLQVVP